MADTETKAAPQKKEGAQPKGGFVREKGRGIVKAVPSGDTIVVLHMDKTQQGPPVERSITLSGIQAPLLGRRKTDKKAAVEDEMFAWGSREYLRKKVVGKQVTYTIDYKNPGGREFGVVTLTTPAGEENLVDSIVTNGWAKVKRPTKEGTPRPEVQALIDLEEQAKKEGKGMYSSDAEAIEFSKGKITEAVPAVLYESVKHNPIHGVVENVRNGSTFKVILTPSFAEITLYLSGVQAPESKEGQVEPWARESKFFAEHYCLNKDVTVILDGVDRYNCYGTLSVGSVNVNEELLKNGLARYVDWSGSRTNFSEAFKAAEKSAREKKLRIWSGTAPQPAAQSPKTAEKSGAKMGKEIHGKIIEVINGGTVVVVDNGGHDHKVNLSSIKVSKLVGLAQKKPDAKEEEKAPAVGNAKKTN